MVALFEWHDDKRDKRRAAMLVKLCEIAARHGFRPHVVARAMRGIWQSGRVTT
ncbi:MAG: hypothetical protein V3R27_09425 [Pseudomonadales bacterium]